MELRSTWVSAKGTGETAGREVKNSALYTHRQCHIYNMRGMRWARQKTEEAWLEKRKEQDSAESQKLMSAHPDENKPSTATEQVRG